MNRGRFLATLLIAPLGAPLGARFARLLGVEVSSQAWPPGPVTDEQIKDVADLASKVWPQSPITDEQIEDAVVDVNFFLRSKG